MELGTLSPATFRRFPPWPAFNFCKSPSPSTAEMKVIDISFKLHKQNQPSRYKWKQLRDQKNNKIFLQTIVDVFPLATANTQTANIDDFWYVPWRIYCYKYTFGIRGHVMRLLFVQEPFLQLSGKQQFLPCCSVGLNQPSLLVSAPSRTLWAESLSQALQGVSLLSKSNLQVPHSSIKKWDAFCSWPRSYYPGILCGATSSSFFWFNAGVLKV